MEPLRPEDPRQVGRYRLEARLGAGGMGRVFLPRHPRTRCRWPRRPCPRCRTRPPGAGQCGAGIPAGTRLAFSLVYSNASTLAGQEIHALAAAARQAGITITVRGDTFANIITSDDNAITPSNASKWAMAEIGPYTQVAYPTTITVFNTQGSFNIGSYSDPQADRLINASVTSPDPNAVKAEAAYLTAQQPALFQPIADSVFAWKKTLSGPPASFASLTQYYLTPELWYFTR